MRGTRKGKKKSNDIVFIVVTVLVCIFVINLFKGNAPAVMGYRILRVVSGSMEPELERGSCIVIKETNASDLREGDIITFISEEPSIYGMYNTHRIYDVFTDTYSGEKLFWTKGDAFDEPDDYPVTEEQIVGKLVTVIPFGKKLGALLAHLSNNNVYFVIVILPLLGCLISYLLQFIKALSDKEEDEETQDISKKE